MACWWKIRAVDIRAAREAVLSAPFVDSGGTNGWISSPPWLAGFVASLQLGGTAVRILCRKLPAYQGIPVHTDAPMFGARDERRFQLPLITDPRILMCWPDSQEAVHLEAGYLYEVNYRDPHTVIHQAPIDRIHIHVQVQGATIARGL
jgi:hypothetical protein